MKRTINTCNLYLLVWVVQIIHTPLNLYGDTISVLVLFALYAWSLYYCYIAITRYKLPAFLKTWTILLVLFSIYGFIRIAYPSLQSYRIGGGAEMSSRQFLIEHWTSMLPVYPFYVFSRKGDLNVTLIRKWSIIFIAVAIIQYYYGQSIAIARLSKFADETAFTNNQGYFIAMVLPLLFFWQNKPTIQYIGLAVLMVFVLLAVKRGAIIVGTLCLLMQIYYSLKKRNRTRTGVTLLMIIAILVFGYFLVSNLVSSNEYFAFRLEETLEGDDSNRSYIYTSLYNYFINDTTPFSFVFGLGADGTVLLLQQQAHNDWLELLIDTGIVGVLVFFVFWVLAFADYKRIVDKEIKYLFLMVLIMLLTRTLFSMSINDMYITITLIIGYCMANINTSIAYGETRNSIQNI